MSPIYITAIGIGASTIFGALLGFFFKNVSHKLYDVIIGLSAGVMLAAAVIGLVIPAFEMVHGAGLLIAVGGTFFGAVVLNLLDYLTPHLHHITGVDQEKHHNNRHLDRVLLFVMAIALHKLPEGMAAGVGFGGDDTMGNAASVAFAICFQNVPEGMVIISPLLIAGVMRLRAFTIASVVALIEVAGVFAGYFLGGISAIALPFMLALAGGAMLYVVSDEMIPESHAHGFQKQATYALIAGFVLIMLLESIL